MDAALTSYAPGFASYGPRTDVARSIGAKMVAVGSMSGFGFDGASTAAAGAVAPPSGGLTANWDVERCGGAGGPGCSASGLAFHDAWAIEDEERFRGASCAGRCAGGLGFD